MASKPRPPRTGWKIIFVILIGIALQIVLNHLPDPIQKHYGDLFRAAIVLLVGGAISVFIEHWLQRVTADRVGSRRATSLRFLARLVLYLAIALALLADFGVGLSSVVFGSAFVTVILGLAGQNFFSNLIAGIGLVIFHPFEVGDRIHFVAWQYPLLMPSYPHEAMKPTYIGVVTDINLGYTTLTTDEGVPMLIPNGVIIQAAIHNYQRRKKQMMRFRFDLDLALDPLHLTEKAEERFKTLPYQVSVRLADVGATTFAILVLVETVNGRDEVIRHEILKQLVPLVQELRHQASNTESQ